MIPNSPCEYINVPLSGLNKQYKEWLMSFVKQDPLYKEAKRRDLYAAKKVDEAVESAIYSLLNEWSLSIRYFDALVSLILFNQIIPAHNDILLKHHYASKDKNNPFFSISFDVDTTKEELVQYIQDYPSKKLEEYKKRVGVKQYRRSKISKEVREMKKIYNQKKKSYDTDKEIFEYLAGIYGCKMSTVRKRVKGK